MKSKKKKKSTMALTSREIKGSMASEPLDKYLSR